MRCMGDYVDIVIVNYNTSAFLRDCIQSIRAHTHYPYRLLVVDNHSRMDEKNILLQLQREGVPVVFNSKNIGCARAWNQAIKLTRGKYLLFLNPDTLVTPDWLNRMVTYAESDPKILVVGNKQINEHGIIMHAGVVEEKGKAVLRGVGEKDHPAKFNTPCDCMDVCGACYLVKRLACTVIGMFDERFFLYAEETDFSFRVRQAGFRVVYCPVTIVHFKDGTPISDQERKRIHQESCRLFDEKWMGRRE